jgi:hypothetical protein
MKGQTHNQGELKEITLALEVKLVEDVATMAKNSGLPEAEIVAIAIKRFRSAHADYMGVRVDYP